MIPDEESARRYQPSFDVRFRSEKKEEDENSSKTDVKNREIETSKVPAAHQSEHSRSRAKSFSADANLGCSFQNLPRVKGDLVFQATNQPTLLSYFLY